MRPENLYLRDIIEACEAIERFLKKTDETKFMEDEIVQSAVLQKLGDGMGHCYPRCSSTAGKDTRLARKAKGGTPA